MTEARPTFTPSPTSEDLVSPGSPVGGYWPNFPRKHLFKEKNFERLAQSLKCSEKQPIALCPRGRGESCLGASNIEIRLCSKEFRFQTRRPRALRDLQWDSLGFRERCLWIIIPFKQTSWARWVAECLLLGFWAPRRMAADRSFQGVSEVKIILIIICYFPFILSKVYGGVFWKLYDMY